MMSVCYPDETGASAYGELHALGTSGPELSRNNNLATLSARLHDEPQHTVAGPSDSQAVQQLVSERFALGDSRQTTVLDLSGVQRDRVLRELEALLDERGELTDATTLLAENLLCVGGANDDVGDGGRDADLNAGVALLGQLALEELVQLGIEDTVWGDVSDILCAQCSQPSIRDIRQVCFEETSSVASSSLTRRLNGEDTPYQQQTSASWNCAC
jgi:hypothetical protein